MKKRIPFIKVKGGKKEFINTLKEIEVDGKPVKLKIKCDCGKEFIYTNYEDIPAENVICECGRKIIEYEKQPKTSAL